MSGLPSFLATFVPDGGVSEHWILDGHEPKLADLFQWANWFETANRGVAKTTVGDAKISTVFLGLDHSFGSGPPLLFETMVFGGDLDQEQDRYATWDQAVAGHHAMVERVRNVSR